MIKWVSVKEALPKEGDVVWVLSAHKRNEIPESCEINCGEVCYSNDKKQCAVWNNDSIGCGSQHWILWEADDYEYSGSGEYKDFWVPEKEINVPYKEEK